MKAMMKSCIFSPLPVIFVIFYFIIKMNNFLILDFGKHFAFPFFPLSL
ncbi:hypothetical protein B4168_1735 [Anoxybacillus flavithermus]|nr:hypothetical protein B4168_1735 [Anoxybacillus flavithermus]OAO87836.1 hypothetical protein GT23_0893 [Parageobacillus thermoglucosidasius]